MQIKGKGLGAGCGSGRVEYASVPMPRCLCPSATPPATRRGRRPVKPPVAAQVLQPKTTGGRSTGRCPSSIPRPPANANANANAIAARRRLPVAALDTTSAAAGRAYARTCPEPGRLTADVRPVNSTRPAT
jgi:hypothetical protein